MKGDSVADIRAACDRVRRETEARIDKKIAGSGVNNPYTGLPFSGVEEFLAYGRRLQADIRTVEAKKARPSAQGVKQSFLIVIYNNGYPLRFESTSIIDVYNCLFNAVYANRDPDFWDTVFVSLAKLKDGGYFAWQLNSEITIYAVRESA